MLLLQIEVAQQKHFNGMDSVMGHVSIFCVILQHWIEHEICLECPCCPDLVKTNWIRIWLKSPANQACSLAYIYYSLIPPTISGHRC